MNMLKHIVPTWIAARYVCICCKAHGKVHPCNTLYYSRPLVVVGEDESHFPVKDQMTSEVGRLNIHFQNVDFLYLTCFVQAPRQCVLDDLIDKY